MIDQVAQREVRAALMEPLLEPMFRPLEEELGDFGSFVTAALARAIAEHAP